MESLLPLGFGLGGHIETTLKGPAQDHVPTANLSGFAPGSDNDYMLRALILSMNGVGRTLPNPAVGCIVVKDDQILGFGATETYGGRHAERVAFDNLKKNGISTKETTTYVTLEPCSHHGRQPPCCELFHNAGVSKLVVALGDPNPLVNGRGLRFVEASGVRVELSTRQIAAAAAAWHLPFLVQQTQNRPLIVGKWAQTLDGTVADIGKTSKWITGPKARAHAHWLRLKYDITAVGLGTLLADAPSLTVRDCWRPNSRQPDVCVIDPMGHSLPEDERFQHALANLLAAADNRKVALICPRHHIKNLENKIPTEIALIGFTPPSENDAIGKTLKDVWEQNEMLAWFGRMPQSIYLEGGAKLLSLMIEAGALDALHVFVAPMLLGGTAHRVGNGIHKSPQLSMAAHFDILSTAVLDGDILVELVSKRINESFFVRG
jgi:diaminohydroxyphosphoribosylaminopyrimidine deaminase/5-amino-6-(5-phosphoribosylamino)uracil reductase